ncbi:MAG: CRISPR-associated primase-polymerase type A1 [Desulfomonilaceae bacterium]|nr:CRISPR-associated primase-polymerase type A1 [Desulfomonilaceae bacterium]
MNIDATLAEVKSCLEDGLKERAIELASSVDTRTVRDSAVHLAWAEVFEDLGLMDELILELNLSIRDDPDRLETYPRLAEVFLDQGLPQRAAKVYAALIEREPEKPEHYQGLGEALKDAREFEKAKEAYENGLERTGDERFKSLIRDLGFLDRSHDASEMDADVVRLEPGTHHLVTFTALFAGREGVHARQWVSPTGKSGYNPVEEPFSPQVAQNHILGNYTVGVYPVRLDNTVNFIAFDLDGSKFAVNQSIRSERAWNALMGKVHDTACQLVDVASQHDVPLYLEDSGFKGRHAWVFLDTPVPAGVAKKFGETMAAQISPRVPEVTVEVFPKQTSVNRSGLGNLIKLPLGIHRRTGKRAVFIEPDGRPVEDQLAVLDRIAKASRRSIYGFIQRLHGKNAMLSPVSGRPASRAERGTGRLQEPEPDFEGERGYESYLPSPPDTFDLDRDPQFQHLVANCAAIRELVGKVNRTSMLTSDETQVLIHTLGHLDRGPETVNELFRRCLNADPALFLKSRLRGNPMSCPKIRARVPGVTSQVPCNCVFDLTVSLYPTPLIHANTMSEKKTVSPLGLTVESLQFQNLVQDYLKLRKQSREIRRLLDRYEERLREFFADAGIDSVEIPTGKLSIVKKEDGKVAFNLEV